MQRVANFKIQLKGGETALKISNNFAKQLERAQNALDVIKEKSDAFDTLTKKASALEDELKNVGKAVSDTNKRLKKTEDAGKSVDEAKKKQGGLKDEIISTRKQIVAYKKELSEIGKVGGKRYNEIIKEVARLKNEQKAVTDEIRNQQRAFDEIKAAEGSYRALNNELVRLRKSYKELGEEARDSLGGKETLARIQQLDRQLKDIDQTIGQSQRNVGNYKQSFIDAFKDVGAGAIGLAGPLSIAFAVEKAVEGAVALANYKLELDKLRTTVNQFTGESGAALDQITAGIQGTAQTFGEDQQEILIATNALVKQFGISYEEAQTAINKGFAAGANASGEFTSILQEYPAQFEAAGLSANEFIAITTQSIQDGVFSDKGADAIKEATLRIREMPDATRDALTGIGLSVDTLQQGLKDGSISAFDVIQQVSGRLSELDPLSKEVGTAIANIFGGPGEDAGLKYLTTLKDINTDLDTVVDSGNKFVETQLKLAEANTRINTLFNQIFGSADGGFQNLLASAKLFLVQGLEAVLKGFLALPKIIEENKDLLKGLGAAFLALNAVQIKTRIVTLANIAIEKARTIAVNASTIAQRGFNAVLKANPIGAAIAAVTLLITGFRELYKRSETVRGGIAGLAAVAKEVFTIIKESISSFVDGFNDIKEGNFKEGLSKIGNSIVKANPIGLALTEGERLGSAFRQGFNDKLEKDRIEEELEDLNLKAANLSITGNTSGSGRGSSSSTRPSGGSGSSSNSKKPTFSGSFNAPSLDDIEFSDPIPDILDIEKTQKFLEKRTELLNKAFEEEKLALQLRRNEGILTEQEYRDQLNELELQNLLDRSELIEQASFDNLALQQEIAEKEFQIQKDKHDRISEEDRKRLEGEKKAQEARKNIAQAQLGFIGDFVSGAKDLLGQDEKNRKKFGGALKALALGEVGINLARELSAIAAAAAANPTNAVTFGAAGTAQYAIQSALAIGRSIAAGIKIAKQQFEFGGELPSDGMSNVQGGNVPSQGVIIGQSHTQGGVKANHYGNLIEMQGGEYRLKNGNEQYIINARSTRKFKPQLDKLKKNPSRFSPGKRIIASMINSHKGWGIPFEFGGALPTASLNTNPLPAPQLPPQQVAGFDSSELRQQNAMMMERFKQNEQMIEATNKRIDRITVIANASDIVSEGLKQKESKEAQGL